MDLSTIFGVVIAILGVAIMLYLTNHIVRYYIKFGFNFVVVMATAILYFPIALLWFIVFRERDVRHIGVVFKTWSYIFKILGITYEFRGMEHLASDKPCVLVCNHQSSLDVIGLTNFWPPRMTVLGKKELLFFGPFGISCWLSGIVFIDRLHHEKARETLEQTAKHMHDHNVKICIFPEGTRNRDGKMLPFKKGAFNLAVKGQVPVVPVVMSCYKHFHSKKLRIFNPGHVIVTCLPPVSTEGLSAADVPELTERVRTDMEAVYESSSVEVEEYARKVGNTDILDKLKALHEE